MLIYFVLTADGRSQPVTHTGFTTLYAGWLHTHTHSLDIDLQQSPMGDCVERRKTHSLIAFWSCEVEGEWWEGGVTSQSNRPTDKGVRSDWEVEKPINLE